MNQSKPRKMTKKEKIKSLMDYFGITKKEAIIELKDMGLY